MASSEQDIHNDNLDDVASSFEQERQKEDEQIVKSNKFGNGFQSEAPNQSGTYEPQKLNATHREILRLVSLGYKGTMISKMLGCTPQTVYNIKNSPLGQALLDEIQEARTGSVKDVQKRLQEASPLAAEIVVDIMQEGKKESNKLKSALKVLEMTGHKPGETHNHNHLHMTKDDLNEIKGRVQDEEIADKGRSFNEDNRPSQNGEDIQDAEIIDEEE
jgi:hypothetical protein